MPIPLTLFWILIVSILFNVIASIFVISCQFRIKELKERIDNLCARDDEITQDFLREKHELEDEIVRLKALPPPEKKVLTVEAQQILHDMTSHGNAIVRIVPLSPTDVFWRAPT